MFANRALIRARLGHWDAALRDAETVGIVFIFHDAPMIILLHGQSIEIQPSVTAHVAKGFALFGQQKYTSAVHAFNLALRDCDARDKGFVSLVKVSCLSMCVHSLINHFSVVSQLSCLRLDIMLKAWPVSLT